MLQHTHSIGATVRGRQPPLAPASVWQKRQEGTPLRRSSTIVGAVKSRSGKQVASSKTLVVKQGHQAKVEKLVADIAQVSMQRAADRASGIQVFEVVKDQWEPGTYHIWERYASNADLGKHNTSQEYQAFMTKVQPHLEHPVAMALYEWKDGKLGAVSMSEGPKGEGGLDDATGASGAAGGASMKQTSSAFNLVGVKEEEGEDLLSTGLAAARKQMDGFKQMLGNVFGGGGNKNGGKGDK